MILYLSHTRVAIVLYSCYICGWVFCVLICVWLHLYFCVAFVFYLGHICVIFVLICVVFAIYVCIIYIMFVYFCVFSVIFVLYISVLFLLIISVCSLSFQELEITLEEERRSGDDARSAVTLLERKRIALQTELEDVRALLETVSIHGASMNNKGGYAHIYGTIHMVYQLTIHSHTNTSYTYSHHMLTHTHYYIDSTCTLCTI